MTELNDADLPRPACRWTYDPDYCWDTGCKNAFSFTDGGPAENEFKYCCYCGGKLVVRSLIVKE